MPTCDDNSPQRLAVDAKNLAAMLCTSLRTIRTWDAAGTIPSPIRVGGRVLWRVSEIDEWLAAGSPDRKTWDLMRSRSAR
jgi:prophage regulatory protein